jgi:very-short-patch-repair endonuclease
MDDPKQPTPKPSWNVPPGQRRHARELRKKSTDAERLMWGELRDKKLNGFSFKRQVPIGPYIADFACHAKKLVVEIDGGQHFSDEAEREDAVRTAAIEARGFQVIRFGNAEVMGNREGVLQSIATELAARALTPTLSRKRERGRAAGGETSRPTQNASKQRPTRSTQRPSPDDSD